MTQRSHRRVRALLCSVSAVGVVMVSAVAPTALSQTPTAAEQVAATATPGAGAEQVTNMSSPAAPTAPDAGVTMPTQAGETPKASTALTSPTSAASKPTVPAGEKPAGQRNARDTQKPPEGDQSRNSANALRFGEVMVVSKGINIVGNHLYTLRSNVASADLGQDEIIRLVRQDLGDPVKVLEARFNSMPIDVTENTEVDGKQTLNIQPPAVVSDSNLVEVDIEVDPVTALSSQTWSLETASAENDTIDALSKSALLEDDAEALDDELEFSPEFLRSQAREANESEFPENFAQLEKIEEFIGGPTDLNNFSIGKNPSFVLTEAVPEEDDGKVAIMRFTFKVDGLSALHGPFDSLKFNPRGWFNLARGATLEGLPYLWLNDNKETNPEKSLSEQTKNGRAWVRHSVDKKTEEDEWYSTHFLIPGNRPQIKNGDTFTVRYKLTRDYEAKVDSGLSGTPTSHTYWVNTHDEFTRYDFSDDFKTIKVGRQFPAQKKYGDIAVTPDGKELYAVEFVASFGSWVMDKYDARTGALIGRSSFKLGALEASDGDGGPQLNALTFDHDGKLIFSTPKKNNIWKMDPSCLKDPALKSTCELGKDIEKLDLKWPKVPGGWFGTERQLTSAGDFIVGPDGSLFGAGTTDAANSESPSILVHWPAKEPGNPAAGRAEEGIVIGELPRPTYGMGRFGDFILSTQTNKTHTTRGNSGLVWSQIVPDGKGGYTVEGEPLEATVESTAYGIFKPGESLWGATSVYDAGPYNELILKIEKEVVGDRLAPTDQFELGAFLENSPFTNSRSYSMPPVFATTPETGLQKEVSYNFVKPGLEYGIFEGFRTATSEGERKSMTKENAEKYRTSLKCVEGDTWSKDGKEVPTAQLSELTGEMNRESKLTIPTTPGLKAVTCRFINSTEPEEHPSLALFKAAETTGQNKVELLCGAKFELYEKDETQPDHRGKKVTDIEPNPEKGYSVDGLEYDKRYILVETQAPDGYLVLTPTIEFAIVRDKDGKPELKLFEQPTEGGVVLLPGDPNAQEVKEPGDVVGVAMTVLNVEQPQLPKTGGPGVHRMIALGVMVLAFGGMSMAHTSGIRRRVRP